jgi:acyl-coenzyme A thioesterase 13
MEGRVVSQKGTLTAVAVEIHKKESSELLAIERQWVAPWSSIEEAASWLPTWRGSGTLT